MDISLNYRKNFAECDSADYSDFLLVYLVSIIEIFEDKKLNNNNSKTMINEKIISDTCEAIIGAVYIDRGYSYVKEFVLRLWSMEISKSNITYVDSKTQLQEHSLKLYKKLPKYRLISSKGPKHNLIFKMSVMVSGSKEFIGIGNSKQEAEQNAANNLLKHIMGS